MKIALVNPPYRITKEHVTNYAKNSLRRAQPVLSLAILATELKQLGHEILYLDSVIEGIDQTHHFDEYTDYYGLSIEQIKERINSFGADQVWMTCLCTALFPLAEKIAQSLEQPVIIGGNHASLNVKEISQNDTFYSIVCGEADNQIENIFRKMEHKKIIHLPRLENMDTAIQVDWSLLPLMDYWEKALPQNPFAKSRKTILYETSRGCPERCIFCSTTKFFGNKFRPKSSQFVVDEITAAVRKYNIEEVQFTDDSMGVNAQRFMEICDGLKPLKIHLCNPSGIRLYTKDENQIKEIFQKMKDAGFYQFTFAVESGNERVLNKLIRKRLDLKFTEKLISMAKEYFKVHVFLIMGLPGETMNEMQDTIDLARRIKADSYSISLAQPFPKTDLEQLCKDSNYIIDGIQEYDMLLGRQTIKRDDNLDIEKLVQDLLIELNN